MAGNDKKKKDDHTVQPNPPNSGPDGEGRPDGLPGRPNMGTGIAEIGAKTIEKYSSEAQKRKERMDEMLGLTKKKKK